MKNLKQETKAYAHYRGYFTKDTMELNSISEEKTFGCFDNVQQPIFLQQTDGILGLKHESKKSTYQKKNMRNQIN